MERVGVKKGWRNAISGFELKNKVTLKERRKTAEDPKSLKKESSEQKKKGGGKRSRLRASEKIGKGASHIIQPPPGRRQSEEANDQNWSAVGGIRGETESDHLEGRENTRPWKNGLYNTHQKNQPRKKTY